MRLAAGESASGKPGADVRYRIQYTADQAYVDLLEQARALLWHRLPTGDLVELQRLALEALVERLVGRKYGAGARATVVARARSTAGNSGRDEASAPAAPTRAIDATENESARGINASKGSAGNSGPDQAPATAGPASAVEATADECADEIETLSMSADAEATTNAPVAAKTPGAPDSAPARRTGSPSPGSHARPKRDDERPVVSRAGRSRHVPAAVRSAVWLRDAARCTFVDARGVRCRGTTALELHHEQPFARGGPATVENLRLRCRAHNTLAAEQDFGREVILARKQDAIEPDTPTR